MASENRTSAGTQQSVIETDNGRHIDTSRSDACHKSVSETRDEIMDDGKRDMIHLIQNLSKYLCNFRENGEELAAGFQRIPNRRVLPDYFEIISEPLAFSTIRSKIQRKQYICFSEFVKDVAQICHNAQVYNRPSAPIFGAAVRLRELFRDELRKLATAGDISSDDADLPDLGELPSAEDSSMSSFDDGEDDGDVEEDEDDDEEDRDEGFCVEDGIRLQVPERQLRSSRFRQSSWSRKDGDENKGDASKKRGRPPLVLTPMEARIFSILKGLRKFKDGHGDPLIRPFEKLPDKSQAADYYKIVSHPIALDSIRKKAKRKTYENVDQVMSDLELMFENAKRHNQRDSEVANAAVELQRQARLLAQQEMCKPDEDFRDEDGRLPLDAIEHNGQIWRVGDWVHIRNPNDSDKPIIAQIFKTWQDRVGLKWVNACWYYRPEQTVHRHEKYFYDREVLKTSQYRNHQVDEILDHCFVMFVTRFNKGRPRGLPPNQDVYICESRYNEEKFRFNKIKTWASCLPEEVRDKDYEMDLLNVPNRLKKFPSPIKHLLRDDAKEADEFPRPTWGSQNAPPIVGAVHRRPLEPNESPPPEITPPPTSVPAITDVSSNRSLTREGPAETSTRASFMSPSHYGNAHTTPHVRPATPATSASAPRHQTPVPIPHASHHQTSVLSHFPVRPVHYQHQQHQIYPTYAQNYPSTGPRPQQPASNHFVSQSRSSQAHLPPVTRASFAPQTVHSMYNQPRPSEVFTLPGTINDAMPLQLRQRLHSDTGRKIFFFTGPPLDRSHKGLAPGCAGLGHSVRYLAGRRRWLSERAMRRKARVEATADDAVDKGVALMGDESMQRTESISPQATDALDLWFLRLDQETQQWRRATGLVGWDNRGS
ncbi:hypothetical protein L249_7391 [Ophiocordyceps polyrhachis-furcata BCC 54312]|uniref:BAH domain-containing protein n=1 Tax=Ophiocordyceps polyrhachis-furcata BCC 54312 TaxID=1330021 RepID=A0A367LBA9_9HYPO|nr:hypothetical protein L249_7391 [Ophiocordyceps polyrhachis-furcata BCC 54312]